MVLGIIADTQQMLTPAQISALKKAFQGVDGILHAGPVGDLRVLDQLGKIAPTRAVCGNAESPMVRSELFVRQAWKVGPLLLGLLHGYGKPMELKGFLLRQFAEDKVQPNIIVYGSNFEPTARSAGGVYFFNPGSFAGRLPEGSPGTGPSRVGLLFIRGKKVDGQAGIPLRP